MVDYVFKPYNEKFSILFQKEKNRIENFLSGTYLIEHFGSTSVQGLGGKGIIDIYIIAPKITLPQVFQFIKKAGYEARPAASNPERFVYVRELVNSQGEKERYHVHITFPESFESKRDLAFRDYLRTHSEDAAKYAAVKKEAAAKANGSKEMYMQIKTPIIEEILKKVLS